MVVMVTNTEENGGLIWPSINMPSLPSNSAIAPGQLSERQIKKHKSNNCLIIIKDYSPPIYTRS